jgi:hypothetical protein
MWFMSHNYWLKVESDSKLNWLDHFSNMQKVMVKTRESAKKPWSKEGRLRQVISR